MATKSSILSLFHALFVILVSLLGRFISSASHHRLALPTDRFYLTLSLSASDFTDEQVASRANSHLSTPVSARSSECSVTRHFSYRTTFEDVDSRGSVSTLAKLSTAVDPKANLSGYGSSATSSQERKFSYPKGSTNSESRSRYELGSHGAVEFLVRCGAVHPTTAVSG